MLIGRTLLSRYKITKSLGGGGFGDTYKAVDIALPDNPPCMVKHLLPKSSNPSILPIAKELFEREAKTLYHLGEHNQIPRLYAHFEENGEFYLVQEFIDGHDLSEEITIGKKINEKQTIRLLQDILEVLTFVHEQNVIHRDIKPSNIMRRNKDRKLVLIDFGSVKVLSALTLNAQGLTDVTIGVGSSGYMPSEQARGKPKLASDVYAVGIIGIQALTGLAPQQFPEDPNTGEIIWRDLVSVNTQLADALDKMVKDHFSLRYQNASQALKALTPTQITTKPKQNNNNNNNNNNKRILPAIPALIGIIIVLSGVGFTVYKLVNKSNITYSNLDKLLAQENWQEADIMTANLLLKIGDQDNSDWLDSDEINNFDCDEIKKIDLLWQYYSGGKFGFDIQKKAYLETGNKLGDYDEQAYKAFGEKIGWFKDNQWVNYETIFSFSSLKDASLGLLPLGRRLKNKEMPTIWLSNNGKPRSQLFLRTQNCKISSNLIELENLLQEKKWQEADRKTAALMLKLSDREQQKWIDVESMNKIDCQHISAIDQLWLKHSDQKFGFSVQKRIWYNIISTSNLDQEFGKQVGWFNGDRWLRSYDLNYELEEAPKGYFPSVSRPGDLSSGWTGRVLLSSSWSKQSDCLDQ